MPTYPDYAEVLIAHGWEEVTPMTFISKQVKGVEIFFASSNAIEIYKQGDIFIDHYLTGEDDLLQLIGQLTNK